MRNREQASADELNKEQPSFVQKISRRSFMLSAATQAAAIALLRKKEQDPLPTPQSIEELLYIVQRDIGPMRYEERYAASGWTKENPPEDDQGAAPVGMLMEAAGHLHSQLEQIRDDPAERIEEIQTVSSHVTEYVTTYQQSKEQVEQAKQFNGRIDCNDHTNVTAERLARYGVPMYAFNIWPRRIRDRFTVSWHQMATCKIGKREYLMFDNGLNLTHWHGSLKQFGWEYPAKVPMTVMPIGGIARIVPSAYDHWTAKIAQQLHHTLDDESQMELLPLHSGRNRLLAQR